MNIKLSKNAKMPVKASPEDAGFDLFSMEDKILKPGERYAFPLGFAIEIPDSYAGLVQGKSGRAVKEGVDTIGNVIDSSYRGECHAILINHGEEDVIIKAGQKIAQLIIVKISSDNQMEEVGKLSETIRGEGKFGSTGI